MKKSIFLASVLMAFMIFTTHAADPCGFIDLSWLKTHSPIPPGNIVSKRSVGSLCEIILQIENEYVPLFAGQDFIIAGEMLQNRKQVTKERIDSLKAEQFKSILPQLDTVTAITYRPVKSTNRKIYMITDPLCPYCSVAAEKILQLADAVGFSVNTVLYSVHGMEGDNKILEVVCKNYSLGQYSEEEWKNTPFDEKDRCEKGEKLIEATREIIAKAGITGVPVFIFQNGKFVNGANMTAIERILKEGKDQ